MNQEHAELVRNGNKPAIEALHKQGQRLDLVGYKNHCSICQLDLHNADLRQANFQQVDINNCNFDHCTFDGSILSGARFYGCSLYECSMFNVDLNCTQFYHCDLRNTDFADSIKKSYSTNFSKCNLSGAKGSFVEAARMEDCNLPSHNPDAPTITPTTIVIDNDEVFREMEFVKQAIKEHKTKTEDLFTVLMEKLTTDFPGIELILAGIASVQKDQQAWLEKIMQELAADHDIMANSLLTQTDLLHEINRKLNTPPTPPALELSDDAKRLLSAGYGMTKDGYLYKSIPAPPALDGLGIRPSITRKRAAKNAARVRKQQEALETTEPEPLATPEKQHFVPLMFWVMLMILLAWGAFWGVAKYMGWN